MTKSSFATKSTAADNTGSASKKKSYRHRTHRQDHVKSRQTKPHAAVLPGIGVSGPFETAAFRDQYGTSSKYRRFVRAAADERLGEVEGQWHNKQAARTSPTNTKKVAGRSLLYHLRRKATVDVEEEDIATASTGTSPEAVTAGRVVPRLLLARAFDAQRPSPRAALSSDGRPA